MSGSTARAAHIVVVGAGIVGAACADALTENGFHVTVVDTAGVGHGATAAGMGHIVAMDDSEAQFALTKYSRDIWNALADDLPRAAERVACGTLWVAADDEEMQVVAQKCAFYRARGVRAEMLDSRQLAAVEPSLRPGLPGALLIPDDSVVYPPPLAAWLLKRACARGAALRIGIKVSRISDVGVELADGGKIACDMALVAVGAQAKALLPEIQLRPRKGHLVITDRHPNFVRHQLVELGYLKSAHGSTGDSVAFNVQPRATGQVLIGSSRQFDNNRAEVDHGMAQRMLARAVSYMPGLANLSAIRIWTGFRAATPDKLPLIGPHPTRPNVWLATGHEGLGITTSMGTARLVADMLCGRVTEIPAAPYSPCRAGQIDARSACATAPSALAAIGGAGHA